MAFIGIRSVISGIVLLVGLYVAFGNKLPQLNQNRLQLVNQGSSSSSKINPKILIVSLFSAEADVWYEHLPGTQFGDLQAQAISVPGLSPQYPSVYCTAHGDICQITTGMSEINAAATITAVILSEKFDFRKTYFLIAGIAGVNPKRGTLGSVALSQFAVQVALQYEIDPRELPSHWETGYFSFGTDRPAIYPTEFYGTEVFELNGALRDLVAGFASLATLNDTDYAQTYRSKFESAGEAYHPATLPPSVIKCDATTSDVFFSGYRLADTFEKVVSTWTSDLGKYCMSAMEDNAVLEVLVRFHVHGLVDFNRAILLRTGSNFDRAPPGVDAVTHLRGEHLNGIQIARANIYLAGIEIVKAITRAWDSVFFPGVLPSNYVGDILGTLGGYPDFRPANGPEGKS